MDTCALLMSELFSQHAGRSDKRSTSTSVYGEVDFPKKNEVSIHMI